MIGVLRAGRGIRRSGRCFVNHRDAVGVQQRERRAARIALHHLMAPAPTMTCAPADARPSASWRHRAPEEPLFLMVRRVDRVAAPRPAVDPAGRGEQDATEPRRCRPAQAILGLDVTTFGDALQPVRLTRPSTRRLEADRPVTRRPTSLRWRSNTANS